MEFRLFSKTESLDWAGRKHLSKIMVPERAAGENIASHLVNLRVRKAPRDASHAVDLGNPSAKGNVGR